MSALLWRHFWADDVESFRNVLAASLPPDSWRKGPWTVKSPVTPLGSEYVVPLSQSTPKSTRSFRQQKPALQATTASPRQSAGSSTAAAKRDINNRDNLGLTLLLRAASSRSKHAIGFVRALLDHPHIDLYLQDFESGWTALHRALYNGNLSIARLLLQKEQATVADQATTKWRPLIKIKDHEGNSPFEVYNFTITDRDKYALPESSEMDHFGSLEDMSYMG